MQPNEEQTFVHLLAQGRNALYGFYRERPVLPSFSQIPLGTSRQAVSWG